MSHVYDSTTIDSGPADLAVVVYAQRVKLDTPMVEKAMVNGGQVLTAYEVDNYPGLPEIGGYDLGLKFREHVDHLGARFMEGEASEIEGGGRGVVKNAVCQGSTYEAGALVLATEAVHRRLGVPGEEELAGAGVSYCATCDGAFFHSKVVTVIGGGDVAAGGAIFLARMCSRAYLIYRRDELWVAKNLQEDLLSPDNMEAIWDTVADSTNGDGMVESFLLINVESGQKRELQVQGVFITVGTSPESRVLEGLVDMNHGHVRTREDVATPVSGIFAAGDVRIKLLHQIIAAATNGANAIASVGRCLVENQGRQAADE